MSAARGRVSGAPLSIARSASSPTSALIWSVCLRKLRNVVLVKETEALKVAPIYPGEEWLWKDLIMVSIVPQWISFHSRMGSI